MGKRALTVEEAQAMFLHLCESMIAQTERLTEADQAIGDGDHGVGMARGFEALRARLQTRRYESLEALFQAVGTTLLMSIGGAAGAIYGTLFRGGAAGLRHSALLDAQGLAQFLSEGLQAVMARGKAQPGDKTLVDALHPAATKAVAMVAAPLDESLRAVARAAWHGMERTTEMVAKVGKAKTLGERSLGHPDPGALSLALILQQMAAYVAEQPPSEPTA